MDNIQKSHQLVNNEAFLLTICDQVDELFGMITILNKEIGCINNILKEQVKINAKLLEIVK